MTISTPTLVLLSLIVTFFILSRLVQKALKRPVNMSDKLALLVVGTGVLLASFLGEWLAIDSQWQSCITMATLMVLFLLAQIFSPTKKS
jgi:predicted MFS family arabinose efflux permease